MKLSEILKKYNIQIKKSFGQNFLINKGLLKEIIKFAEIEENERIIEIGPGLGTLTEELYKHTKKITVIEKDKTLIPVLKDKFGNKIKIIEADALEIKIKDKNYKIVANIPYYISSPLIKHFLKQSPTPKKILIMTQLEFAQKICDIKKSSVLALEVKLFAKAKIKKIVSKNSFFPAPKIKSAILEIIPYSKNDPNFTDRTDGEKILQIAKITFSNKRKYFFKTLEKQMKLSKEKFSQIIVESGLNEKIRPEEISIENFKKLIKLFD